MVQTRKGCQENPWFVYMRACAENYNAGHREPPPVTCKHEEGDLVKKRLTKNPPTFETPGKPRTNASRAEGRNGRKAVQPVNELAHLSTVR